MDKEVLSARAAIELAKREERQSKKTRVTSVYETGSRRKEVALKIHVPTFSPSDGAAAD